jgi:hypothetical protein
MNKLLAAVAVASCLIGGAAQADTAIQSYTGGTTFPVFSSDETVGWTFKALDNMVVTSLGWYAIGGDIDSSHQMGIWDASGTLLGQATVTAGAPDGSGVRYVGVGPINLFSGLNYFIGGRDANDNDSYATSVSDLVTSSSIQFLGSANSSAGSGFAFPNTVNNITTGGRFGANFQFRVVDAAVPEPGTWALMICGFGLAGSALRYRTRQVSVTVV